MSKTWQDIPEQSQEDLLDWYNRSEVDDTDRELLANLFRAGQFQAWDCPNCGDRVYEGTPEHWRQFQGVRQVDYASYPGKRGQRKFCDYCRCHNGR